jgi:transposase InsO family protein
LKRGPRSRYTDQEVLQFIKNDLQRTPFTGEGYRKVHARLRIIDGVRVGGERVLRIMREQKLLSPYRLPTHPPREHDGTIVTAEPNLMWGTDGARVMTVEDGLVWGFPAVDHFNFECVGCHVAKHGDRFAALEPLKQGLEMYYGGAARDCARGLTLRLDNGPQYLSDDFRNQVKFWGIALSYSFVREPETNGVSERFVRLFKEQVVYGKIYQNVKELSAAVKIFVPLYNREWRLERLKFATPLEAREKYLLTKAA